MAGMTRDELLEKLQRMDQILQQLQEIENRGASIEASYTARYGQHKPYIPRKKTLPKRFGGKIGIAIYFVSGTIFFGILYAIMLPFYPLLGLTACRFISVLLPIPVTFVLTHLIVKFVNARAEKKNDWIDQQNLDINEDNSVIDQQNKALYDKEIAPAKAYNAQMLQQLQQECQAHIASWFPEKYLNHEAIGFFYAAIRDRRADELEEAINLYETTLYRNRMEGLRQTAIAQQQQLIEEQAELRQQQLAATQLNLEQQERVREAEIASAEATKQQTEAIRKQTKEIKQAREDRRDRKNRRNWWQ